MWGNEDLTKLEWEETRFSMLFKEEGGGDALIEYYKLIFGIRENMTRK